MYMCINTKASVRGNLYMYVHCTYIIFLAYIQVGPSMLVLGSKARDNGLDKSLLERLLLHYQDMDHVTSNHRVTLVTNYRCHPDILQLSGSLFYETPLKPPDDKAPPMLHPDYSTSFLFICSSFSEQVAETHRNTNREEAVIILNKLKELHERWPYREWGDRDLFRACIMSPSRSQVCVHITCDAHMHVHVQLFAQSLW